MLDPGDPAPEFALPDQNGDTVRLADFHGRKNLVLFFYPKDNTLVCNLEVCAFRDAHPSLMALDTVVLGISADPISSHHQYIQRWNLPFSLLTDASGEVRRAYQVRRTFGLFPGRVTYVIDKEGMVRGAINDPLRAGVHVKEALAALQDQRSV